MKKLAINGGKNHSVIVSEEQSAGRGRFGRSFYSPAQKRGLYECFIKNRRFATKCNLHYN